MKMMFGWRVPVLFAPNANAEPAANAVAMKLRRLR
jgi:hypothetical protein